MKIINLFGGPGTGKSTTAAGLFYWYKTQGKKVELVTEYAKDLVYEKRTNILQLDQLYIFTKQHRRIYRLLDQNYDYVITDSPLMLSLIYLTAYTGNQFYDVEKFSDFVLSVIRNYENINIFLKRNDSFEFQNEGRVQDKEESERLDMSIMQTIYINSDNLFTLEIGDNTVMDIIKIVSKMETLNESSNNN